jgi:glycosyltransferase involved in cell wall biosynthesis
VGGLAYKLVADSGGIAVMKLVMFTPAIKTSAIGRMASLVTQALLKLGHSVDVIRTEDLPHLQSEAHDFGTGLVAWTESARVENLVRSADAVSYQVGDNYAYHRGCLQWLSFVPGVICLHDFFLANLFYEWARKNKIEAGAILCAWYGEEVARQFFVSHKLSEEFIEANKDIAPMTEWICSMARGVITHSGWGIQRVMASCAGPVRVIPLAYDSLPSVKGLVNHGTEEFNLLTVGNVNPNKRTESVIQAIANSAVLRSCTTYRVVGYITPGMAERLSALARALQVKLIISGEVSPASLTHAMSQADVICCLRWPSLEAASASAIEAMLYGRPVIVTDTGFYSELPDTCVRKIRIQNEILELQQALEQLYENVPERIAMGVKAAEWAAVTYQAENYASQLIDISLAAQRAAPMLKAAQSLAGTMWQWEASPGLLALRDTLSPLRLFDNCQPELAPSVHQAD